MEWLKVYFASQTGLMNSQNYLSPTDRPPGRGVMAVGHSQYKSKDVWKAKSLRSAFGMQCLASLHTAPACGFGSSIREAGSKVSLQVANLSLNTLFLSGHHCSREAVR